MTPRSHNAVPDTQWELLLKHVREMISGRGGDSDSLIADRSHLRLEMPATAAHDTVHREYFASEIREMNLRELAFEFVNDWEQAAPPGR
jgi:hypothetical protein